MSKLIITTIFSILAINIGITYWQADGNWKCVFSNDPAICQNIEKITTQKENKNE